MVHWHSILWTQSIKLPADFIGHGGIADFGRVSRLSRLNSGPKLPTQTIEKYEVSVFLISRTIMKLYSIIL
jgi:hypothetical protein